jgi:hypothetical protein
MKDLYSTPEARLDTVLGDADFWVRMQRARSSEEGEKNCKTDADTWAWFRDIYGIELLLIPNSGYSREVNIVDEQKYMIFLLKWA